MKKGIVIALIALLVGFVLYTNYDSKDKDIMSSVEEPETKLTIEDVMENADQYPKALVDDLERNPEMLGFVANYPNAEHVAVGGISEDEKKQKCPLFIQWDSRWGYMDYGNSVMGVSGCGPTCLSMVVYSLTGDEEITPAFVASQSMAGGYYVENVGTSWNLFDDFAKNYGISVSRKDEVSEDEIKSTLDKGGLYICSMGPGDFTNTGHFIVIRDYTDEGIIVNDPFRKSNSQKIWSYDELKGQTKSYWSFQK